MRCSAAATGPGPARAALLVALGVAALAVAVAAGLFAGVGAAAHEEPQRTIFGLELAADGDAAVYWVVSLDLDDEEQREVYESVAANETRQEAFREDAVADLEAAAANASAATDREMRIRNATVETYERGGYGRVQVRAVWENLAWADDERVVVTEPFAGGYEPSFDRVAIHGPEGYVRGALEPDPVRAQRNSGLWNPGTSDFSTFHAEFVAEGAEDGGEAGGNGDNGGNGDGGDREGSDDGRFDGIGNFLTALALALVPVALVLLAARRLTGA